MSFVKFGIMKIFDLNRIHPNFDVILTVIRS